MATHSEYLSPLPVLAMCVDAHRDLLCCRLVFCFFCFVNLYVMASSAVVLVSFSAFSIVMHRTQEMRQLQVLCIRVYDYHCILLSLSTVVVAFPDSGPGSAGFRQFSWI